MEQGGFEWDDEKAALNESMHGVSFEEARDMFSFDPNRIELFDEDHSEEEARYSAIGFSPRGRLLFVVITLRGENTRVVHARIADAEMEKLYEQNN